jgi:hypothetical protein
VTDPTGTLLRGLVIGVGAAGLMDVWALLLRRGFGVPTLDYALLGRWIGHFPRGRFVHERIARSEPVRGERPLGWLAHYAIGVAFAVLLLAIWGQAWLRHPTLGPALLIGLGTIVAPWFVMQPSMGAGIAGSRTPDPRATRLRNLGSHLVYGIGLYLAALALQALAGQSGA